jgi:hypothetical protein
MDRFIDIAVEESNAENLGSCNHQRRMRGRNLGILPDASSRLPSCGVRAGRIALDATPIIAVLQFRFAHKFGKLFAGAKRGNSKQIYRGGVAASQEISARVCTKRFVLRRSGVWTL